MHHKKRFLIGFIVFIILICGIVLVNRPKHVIQSSLKIKLPDSASIMNYELHGTEYAAKIKIAAEDKSDIEEQLNSSLSLKRHHEDDLERENTDIANKYSWWSIKADEVDVNRLNLKSPKWIPIFGGCVKTFVEISKEENGSCYIYILSSTTR